MELELLALEEALAVLALEGAGLFVQLLDVLELGESGLEIGGLLDHLTEGLAEVLVGLLQFLLVFTVQEIALDHELLHDLPNSGVLIRLLHQLLLHFLKHFGLFVLLPRF